MRSRLFAQLLVSVLAVLTAFVGAGSAASAAAAACKVPKPRSVPAAGTVVGTGSAKSCTQRAFRSAVARGGHVTFNCGGAAVTISLTSELKVPKTTVIDGAGKVTLSGGKKHRILVPQSGIWLSVRNLRLINGHAGNSKKNDRGKGAAIAGGWRTFVEVIGSTFQGNSAGAGGGAIYVGTASSLSIVRSTFTSNKTNTYGGAIFSLLSPLTVVDSTFTKNSSKGGGGAIGTDGASAPDRRNGEIRICGTVFDRNTSGDTGGAAFLWTYAPERIVIDRTTFKSNKAKAFGGAARLSTGAGSKKGSVTVRDSSFLSNTAKSNGGALYVDCAPKCTFSNSTFYKNKSSGFGGAVFGERHTSNNVTYAYNTALGQGGALFGGKYVLNNTVFVGNGPCNSKGKGHNVVQWGTTSKDGGSTPCIAKVTRKNPRLAAPAANGGPTLTMMPAANSPLLKAGSKCTAKDQRGTARTSKCDVGAVERSGAAPAGALSATKAPAAPPATAAAPAANATPTAAARTSSAPARALRPVDSHGPLQSVTGIVLTVLIGTAAAVTVMLLRSRSASRPRAGRRRA